MVITENQLDEWVRGNARDAQGIVVELVWRLVAASSPRPKERRFPLGDSIGQPGPDGVLDVDFSFDPFVPEGRSFWEIGTGLNAGDKATSDYNDLVEAVPEEVRREAEFVFVTPLSGRRDWQHTWKEDAQARWLEARRSRNEWRNVRVIDGTKLIDWLRQFPSVELWLAQTMSLPIQQIDTPEQRWEVLKSIGDPPPLIPQVFLVNRDAACAKLKELIDGNIVQLELDTHFPDQVVDFVSAYIAAIEDEGRIDVLGRCLVVSGVDAWNAITAYRERHILVADQELDLSGTIGTKLLEKARRAGHSVIFGGIPGGVPHPNQIAIPTPKSYQLEEILKKAGYGEERARILAQRSAGNLGVLLRCLQNLSLMPEWAERTATAELAIAVLLGSWSEKSDADRAAAEGIWGNAYGEWIGLMRETALRPGTPLTHRDGVWKFVARYEGWYALGQKLFDEHLDRLKAAAVFALQEKDPKFELPADERYAASIHGKTLNHSPLLRNGLAETLALLGSHPKALTSSTLGKAETTAILAVREILASADWVRWASLNDLLPMLAEAAPGEFLDAVEKTLQSSPCPFDEVFSQEGSGITGANYMTGLLWALETLAWDANLLNRVVITLGELAARDPGGNWANRPENSLRTILLPWLPQTCASIEKRRTAVATLIDELPGVGWKLLLKLLPESHSTSMHTRKPAWREIIPDDWSDGVTHGEYREQINVYSELAINAAKCDLKKLTEIINRMDDLPHAAFDHLLAHLGSDAVMAIPETDRLGLWTELVDFISKHRKFSDAEWAMDPDQVDKLAILAEKLSPATPAVRHQRIFGERDFDLLEEKGDYDSQRIELEERRRQAILEIAANGGPHDVLTFAFSVESPWRVGFTFGTVAETNVDEIVLPVLLDSEHKSMAQFAGGYVSGKFSIHSWQWVDQIITVLWTPNRLGQFLAYLPFVPDTWNRATQLLGLDELAYWAKTNANPYDTKDGLEFAVDKLILHGRPYAAIRCLYRMLYDKQPFDSSRSIRALLAALNSSENVHSVDAYEIVKLIKALQNDSNTNTDDLFQVEWAYLRLLERDQKAAPKLLERKLANEPSFFCEVIRLVFRSKKEFTPQQEVSDGAKNIATNAYRLLSNWQTPPGCKEDGSYDEGALAPWLAAVKKECSETGHLEVAMTKIGQSLVHSPADPDGLWIHRAAASALNARDAEDMRRGFRTELSNARGVFTFTAGKAEREIATKYRTQADAVEAAGYHRLATTIRGLSESYEHDADRESSRDPFDD